MRLDSAVGFEGKHTYFFDHSLNASLEHLDVSESEPLVTFPDDGTPTEERQIILSHPQSMIGTDAKSFLNAKDTLKFEERRMSSASETKLIADGFSKERVNIQFDLILTAIAINYCSFIFSRPPVQAIFNDYRVED